MSQQEHEPIDHFQALVEHLSAFDGAQLDALAELYGVGVAEPSALAQRWCEQPEAFVEVVDARLGKKDWGILERLAQEHDMPIDVNWVGRRSRKKLVELGLMKPTAQKVDGRELDWLPGAVAAILAPRLSGTRPTLLVLLGRRPHADAVELAQEYGVSTEGTHVQLIMRLSEAFYEPGFIDEILARLPHPDFIGGAMMTLELGGICYWREIFGHEMQESAQDEKVVPLMRAEERVEQKRIAELLQEIGVVFRVEEEQADLPLVAVPEELWFGLWSLGQGWLLDWTALSFNDLEEVATRQQRQPRGWDLRAVCKWLVCEADAGHLEMSRAAVTQEAIDRLSARAPSLEIDWDAVLAMATDLWLLEPRAGRLVPDPQAIELLDMSGPAFVREVLSSWGIGIIGSGADVSLPQAVGLDEQWRQRLVDIFLSEDEVLSPWMTYEGVDHMETGAGCLREIQPGDEEYVFLELGLTNTLLCLTKVQWLDMLSLLEPDAWYGVGQLRELLQMSASHALFSQLGHIVQDPHSNYYFPVQRPSFLTLPMHTDAFADWFDELVRFILEPLGVAQRSDDGERLWLDTRNLRVPTPPDWPEEPRIHLVREILGDPDFDFSLPELNGASLHPVPELDSGGGVSIDLPISALMQSCEGKEIVEFDGRSLRLG